MRRRVATFITALIAGGGMVNTASIAAVDHARCAEVVHGSGTAL